MRILMGFAGAALAANAAFAEGSSAGYGQGGQFARFEGGDGHANRAIGLVDLADRCHARR